MTVQLLSVGSGFCPDWIHLGVAIYLLSFFTLIYHTDFGCTYSVHLWSFLRAECKINRDSAPPISATAGAVP